MTDMDDAIDTMQEMASQFIKIKEVAYKQYKPIVSDLCSRVAPLDEVEHILDRVAFCGIQRLLMRFRAAALRSKTATHLTPVIAC